MRAIDAELGFRVLSPDVEQRVVADGGGVLFGLTGGGVDLRLGDRGGIETMAASGGTRTAGCGAVGSTGLGAAEADWGMLAAIGATFGGAGIGELP